MRTVLSNIWLVGALIIGCIELKAANLVISSIGEAAADRVVLMDSAGRALIDGDLVEVVDFSGASDSEIAAAVVSGALVDLFTPFGQPSTVGAGANTVAGTLEFLIRIDLAEDSGDLHLLVWNAGTRVEATEVLVLRLPGGVPADDEAGLPGYRAIHLSSASMVFGSVPANGFATAAIGGQSGFALWIAGELPEGSSPGDLEMTADPDGDGSENILEYALGSGAGLGSSIPRLWLDRREQGTFVRFLRRSDDPHLSYQLESAVSLGQPGGWSVVTTPEAASASPPEPPPVGYEWRERMLPAGSPRRFVRMRVE